MKKWILNTLLGLNALFLLVGCLVIGNRVNEAQSQVFALGQELDSTKTQFNKDKEKLDSAQKNLLIINNDFTNSKSNLVSLNKDLVNLKADLTNIKEENESLQKSPRYILRDPTYKEMIDFLVADQTNRNNYILNIYDCKHFSLDVKKTAEQKGFRCAVVIFSFSSIGHRMVAFQTTDKGLVFVEPQSDEALSKVEKGMRFFRDRGKSSNIDDTIVTDIFIIW